MTKDEALRLALEALTVLLDEWTPARQAQLKGMDAITAVKAALLSRSDGEAKDEQQPTEQWAATSAMDAIPSSIEAVPASLKLQAEIEAMMLTTVKKQRTWVGLTDKDWKRNKHSADFQKGVDWAEEMLKGKNT